MERCVRRLLMNLIGLSHIHLVTSGTSWQRDLVISSFTWLVFKWMIFISTFPMLIRASLLWLHCSSVSGNDKTPFFWSPLSCCYIPYGERKNKQNIHFSWSENSLESWETRSAWNKCCFSSPLSVSKMEMFRGNQSCFSNYCEEAAHRRPTIPLQVYDGTNPHIQSSQTCAAPTTADCTLVGTKPSPVLFKFWHGLLEKIRFGKNKNRH